MCRLPRRSRRRPRRSRFRRRLLSLTGDDIRRVAAERLAPALEAAPVCVLSSREKLTEANAALGGAALTIRDL